MKISRKVSQHISLPLICDDFQMYSPLGAQRSYKGSFLLIYKGPGGKVHCAVLVHELEKDTLHPYPISELGLAKYEVDSSLRAPLCMASHCH